MRLLSISELSARLGVSVQTGRKLAREIPGAVTVGKRTKFPEDAVLAFIQRGGCKGDGAHAIGSRCRP